MNPDFKDQVYYMVIVFFVALALCVTKVAYPQDCDSTLQACDKAVETCTELAKSQRDLISSQDNLIVKVTKQRNEALDMVRPEAGIPWYVTIVVGIAGGVILTRGLR